MPVANRFSCLETDDVETDDGDDTLESQGPQCVRSYVSNIALDSHARDHDLLVVNGKVNGHRATMLIDCGSTHDLISERFARKQKMKTKIVEEVLKVALADGSTSSRPLETTDARLAVGGYGDDQRLTVFPLDRYDVILGKPWLTRNNPAINYLTNEVKLGAESLIAGEPTGDAAVPSELMFISGKQARHALRQGAEGYLAWQSSPDDSSSHEPRKEEPPDKQRDFDELLQRFSDVFPDDLPSQLPPERSVDHEIEVEHNSTPPSKAVYRLSKPEMDELHKQLTALLGKGFIEPSKSPYGAPVFFVKKADGSLRIVCDWRDLNKITIKNKACLPNIDDLFDTVQGARYFTKLDLRSGYNQIRISEKDVPKTAINTPFGHFQFRVMGFGLTNAPATFQALMNSILQPYLRDFVVVFLDDILIFSKTWSEHLRHVSTVLETLRAYKLFCKPSKCEFGLRDVIFLGHKLSGLSISPDPNKIAAVKEWPAPSSIKEVRQFLGFANYFRRFIDHYSMIFETFGGNHRETLAF